jgi:hypothetical protein
MFHEEQTLDFKSVASTISPHRRCAAHFKLVMQSAKTNFALADLHLEVSAQLDLSKFATGRIRSGGQAPQTILTNQ